MNNSRATQRAREGFCWFLIFLTWICFLVDSAEAQNRFWDEPIFYELEPCESSEAPWETWFEDIVAEISPHTVDFYPSPSQSKTNLLVKCNFDNFLNNQLISIEDGQNIDYDQTFTLGTTRSTFYSKSLEMIRADVWINETWINSTGHRIIRHELGHVLGISGHLDDDCEECPETLMNATPNIDYWDFRTLAVLRERYERAQHSIIDESRTRYTPCQWVPGAITALFEQAEGFYWSIEKSYQGRWEVMEFGPAPSCS